MQGNGSGQPQVPPTRDPHGMDAPFEITGKPPGTKFLLQVCLEGMAGKWRSLTALLLTELSLEEFPASPGHTQAPDIQKLSTVLQNELNIKGDIPQSAAREN